MKKLICLLLSLLMLAALASCGSTESAASSEPAASVASTAVETEPEPAAEPESEAEPEEPEAPVEEPEATEAVEPEEVDLAIDLVWMETDEVYTADDGTELVQEGLVSFEVANADASPALQNLQDNLNAVTEACRGYMADVEAFADEDYAADFGAFPYEDSYSCVLYRNDGAVLSLMVFETFYAGGAHGSYIGRCYSFDAATGDLITADTLGEEFSARLKELVLQGCEEHPEREGFVENYAELVSEMVRDEQHICFTDDGICFWSSEDEIAPHAVGAIEIDIPYDAINDVLPEAYRG